ncbi:transposase family protein [Hamadaea sp. NPDC050747]|uniref:helix-turn-helix domain-containing protein n=1 Tax=Hamadaea sp. NPDC050747 TaxID=3155789 RepID=UPI0033EE18B9
MITQKIFADRPSRVETMTGLTSDQVDRLVLDAYAAGALDLSGRRAVGPYRSVLVVLLYLRHNLSEALIAELFGCSQPTVSRLVGSLMPTITTVLTAADDLVSMGVDGLASTPRLRPPPVAPDRHLRITVRRPIRRRSSSWSGA